MKLQTVNFDRFLVDMWKLFGLPTVGTIVFATNFWALFKLAPDWLADLRLGFFTNLLNLISGTALKMAEQTDLVALASGVGLTALLVFLALAFLLDRIARLAGDAIEWAGGHAGVYRRQAALKDEAAARTHAEAVCARYVRDFQDFGPEDRLNMALSRIDGRDHMDLFRAAYRNAEEEMHEYRALHRYGVLYALVAPLTVLAQAFTAAPARDYVAPIVVFILALVALRVGRRLHRAAERERVELVATTYRSLPAP